MSDKIDILDELKQRTYNSVVPSWAVRAAAEIERLRTGLKLITCESINAESMAQNILDGRDPYAN